MTTETTTTTPGVPALADLADKVLSVNDTMTADAVLEIRERLIFAKYRIKELEGDLNTALMDWIRVNGDLVISEDKRLYLGHTKRVKCNDPAATLEAILTETGGDFDAVCECLSSGAFKHGACRKPLGEKWEQHFTEEVVDKVELKEADKRFAPRKQLTKRKD